MRGVGIRRVVEAIGASFRERKEDGAAGSRLRGKKF